MRVVGQHRLATDGALARYDPVVRAESLTVTETERGRVQRGQRRCLDAEQSIHLGIVRSRRRGVARIRRIKIVDLRHRESLRQLQTPQLARIRIAREIPRHHQRPADRIGRRPRLGLRRTRQIKLRRQWPTTFVQVRVDTRRIRIEQVAMLGIQVLINALCGACDANRAQKFVGVERRLTEHFSQAPGGDTAIHLHLP